MQQQAPELAPDRPAGSDSRGASIAAAAAEGSAMAGAAQKDAKDPSTAPKFGEVWEQIQSKYGAKPEKPREVKKTLDKDDFMRIMITQMKHQDPTNPFKAEQMATELAQFSTVEQLHNVNAAIGKLAGQQQPMERLAMTNLIGKTVTVSRERFPHQEGSNASLSFTLPRDAADVEITIMSETGETVLQKSLGAAKKGENTFSWDGKKGNTLPAKGGNYMFRVEAKDGNGKAIETNPQSRTRVVGVSFEGAEPVLLLGSIAAPEKVTLRNIVRIESEAAMAPSVGGGSGTSGAPLSGSPGQAQAQAQAQPAVAAAVPAAAATAGGEQKPAQNFFTFEKGAGSRNIDLSRLTPEVREAIQKFQEQKQEYEQKGFPNGLRELDEEGPTDHAKLNQKGGESK